MNINSLNKYLIYSCTQTFTSKNIYYPCIYTKKINDKLFYGTPAIPIHENNSKIPKAWEVEGSGLLPVV